MAGKRFLCAKLAISVLGAGDFNGLKLQTQGTGGALRFLVVEQVAPDLGIPEECHAGELSGTTCLSSSSRFPLSSGEILLIPVTLPPGCARLATNPVPTGSLLFVITIGIVPVSRLTAAIAPSVLTTITSTLTATRSRASSRSRSRFASP